MEGIIKKCKVSYKTGGFFKLRYIRFQNLLNNTYFLDYDILIDRIGSKADYDKLREVENRFHVSETEGRIVTTDFKEISELLNGVGRLYQYRGIVTFSKTLVNQSLFGVYEGEIVKGVADGFGVANLPSKSIHEVGYYQEGFMYGKQIKLKEGRVVKSIYDVESLGYVDYLDEYEAGRYCDLDLSENVSEAQMHEIRKKKLEKKDFKSSSYPDWLKK